MKYSGWAKLEFQRKLKFLYGKPSERVQFALIRIFFLISIVMSSLITFLRSLLIYKYIFAKILKQVLLNEAVVVQDSIPTRGNEIFNI